MRRRASGSEIVVNGKEVALARLSAKDRDAALAKAMKGDEPSMAVIRELLRADPGLAGKLAGILLDAERELIDTTFGSNLVAKETIPGKLEAMRKELAGPSPTPLEDLLVRRVVTCWLEVQCAGLAYSHNAHREPVQKRLDRAHDRYLSAAKTLATVRRLLVANAHRSAAAVIACAIRSTSRRSRMGVSRPAEPTYQAVLLVGFQYVHGRHAAIVADHLKATVTQKGLQFEQSAV